MMAPLDNQVVFSLNALLDGFVVESACRDMSINGLNIDSREIEAGNLFVAVQGVATHGKEFIPQAIRKGACAVLIDASQGSIECAIPVILVPRLEQALSEIAGRFYHDPSENVLVYGITGTNGKTTCSHLLAQCLASYEANCGVIGTLGYGVIVSDTALTNSANDENYIAPLKKSVDQLTVTGMTTADPISTQKICSELIARDAKVLVMEVSSHGLVQHRVKHIDINTAVFTNLTHDHLDYHVSMQAYGEAKARLFDMTSVDNVIINQDDDFSAELVNSIQKNVRLATYSLSSPKTKYAESSAHFSFSDPVYTSQGVKALLHTPEGDYPVTTSLIGAFNLSNVLAVVSSLYLNNYPLKKITHQLSSLKSVPGRMELIANELDIQVVIDFAHTPDALESALKALLSHQPINVWCVFGCGGDRDASKRSKMAAIAERLATFIVVTNDNPRTEAPQNIFADIAEGFSLEHKIIESRADAIAYAIQKAQKGDIVLIAGKGHEDYQILGSEKIHFSDQQQAVKNLRKREQVVSS